MYQNMSERLTVDYLTVYKSLPIVSHIYFHQKSSTLAYVPEDIVMHSLYAQITFVNALLFPGVYFVSFNNCVFIVSSVAIVLSHNICVCHLLSNKEISSSVKVILGWCNGLSRLRYDNMQQNKNKITEQVNRTRYLHQTKSRLRVLNGARCQHRLHVRSDVIGPRARSRYNA